MEAMHYTVYTALAFTNTTFLYNVKSLSLDIINPKQKPEIETVMASECKLHAS